MTFASARTPMRFNSLGAGKTVWESDMSNLDHLPDLLGCPLAAPFHRKLGRTAKAGQTQTQETFVEAIGWALNAVSSEDAKGFSAHCGYSSVVQYL